MQHTTTALFFTISMHHMHQVLAHNDMIKAIQKKFIAGLAMHG